MPKRRAKKKLNYTNNPHFRHSDFYELYISLHKDMEDGFRAVLKPLLILTGVSSAILALLILVITRLVT